MLLELLAAVQAVDPTTLPLYGIFVLAAGMYPLGVMLGASCSPCCCGCEEGGDLPEALMVSFSGLTKGAEKMDGLLSVSISSCFGSGATATVTAPQGTLDEETGVTSGGGPITLASVTAGGSGYAVLGRVEPTGLTVLGGSGTGAEFSVTMAAADPDDCGRPLWSIASVDVVKAGEGYANGDYLTVSVGLNETQYLAATLYLTTVAVEPTLSASVQSFTGEGASVVPVLSQTGTSPNRWGVTSFTVSDGGSGYRDGDQVLITVDDGTQQTAAVAEALCERVPPELEVEVYGPGSGAEFSITATQFTSSGKKYWRVDGLAVTSGGSGYNSGTLRIRPQSGSFVESDSYWTFTTDSSGAIVGVSRTTEGAYWKSTGVIESIFISNQGSYYKTSSETDSVTVQDGGRFYKEDPSAPAIVADVAVEITQQWPSAGSGAVLTVVVDSVVGSPTFGRVTEIAVDNEGSGYMSSAVKALACCVTQWNGTSVFVPRSATESCVYSKCCGLGTIWIKYNGQTEPPEARITLGCGIEFIITSPPPYTCDEMTFSGVDVFGTGTISVARASSGATPSSGRCPGCCVNIYGAESPDAQCTQEACLEAGGSWQSVCTCGPCNLNANCEESTSLIVDITAVGFENNGVDGGFDRVSASYTLTLSAENGWSDATPGFDPAFGYVGQGKGASAFYNFAQSSDFALCSLYVTAFAEDATSSKPGTPGYCWDGVIRSGPTPFRPAGMAVPFEDGCFVEGSSTNCVREPAYGSNPQFPYGAQINVTVITS